MLVREIARGGEGGGGGEVGETLMWFELVWAWFDRWNRPLWNAQAAICKLFRLVDPESSFWASSFNNG